MRQEWAFRVSSYLTLALACLCLSAAIQPFLPNFRVMLAPVLVLLALACCLEGRLALPAWAANLLGVAIALGGAAWVGWCVQERINEVGMENVPLPTGLLPYLGPLLLALTLVKVFQPQTTRDRWVVQGLGLLLAALACVLADKPEFGLLLLAYLACIIWHLSLFHIHREMASASTVEPPLGSGEYQKNRFRSLASSPLSPYRVLSSLARAAVWTLMVLVIALPLYLVVPRPGRSAWNPSLLFGGKDSKGPRLAQTGFSTEIDLNSTGVVEVDDDDALMVHAEDAQGRPKLDLSGSQRWRGTVLDHYVGGRWLALPPMSPMIPFQQMEVRRPGRLTPPPPPPLRPLDVPLEARGLPDLGPNQFYLTFTLEVRTAGGLFLADPVAVPQNAGRLSGPRLLPAVSLEEGAGRAPAFQELNQTLHATVVPGRHEYRYRQVTCLMAETDLSFPVDEHLPRLLALQNLLPPEIGITEWTRHLVHQLAAKSAYGLTEDDVRSMDEGNPRAAEKVAVALTEYLAHSGEFTYTLDRRREDSSIDPTLDFLKNVKQGHCDWYAGGLALMLRSQGMRSRVVKGFRGAESKGEGDYLIRQNFAHSWVEVLVERQGPDGCAHWHWRTLDPTPSTSAPPPTPFSWARWWDHNRDKGQAAWQNFVADYEGEQQAALLRDSWDSLTTGNSVKRAADTSRRVLWRDVGWLALPPVLIAALWLMFRLRPRFSLRPAERTPPLPFYARLLEILARHAQLRPHPAQTPREFGEVARLRLATSATTVALADLPARLVNLLYRARYGHQPLSHAESQTVDLELDALAVALAR
jgi:transglutaminase-like putative cysteine protease